ncbi:SDR family oxidoreductase [Legionella saoudiensis]|uniref:SDR family oxidoreductase n=1 Tax=Legionella saoudiensis TaxID=1750561 RepID=UPI000730A3D1|nr:SDR family oxidoreductase [Legionella saoudiensis]
MSLNNKTVWITGASSGIGEALAYELARSGARLILSARNQAALERVKNACVDSEKHRVVPLNLEHHQELASQALSVWEEHGPIDLLINNAGLSQRYLVVDSALKLDKKIMDVNFFGAVALTRPVLKKMLQRGSGQIAVVSSMLGLYGIQTRSAYSASKHALRGYFESLRNELANTNIYITLIYPGFINTNITQNSLLASGAPFGKMDKSHERGIKPALCAKKIVHAINHKKPVVVIAGFKERFGAFIARFFPALFRYISPKFEV